MQPDYSYQPEPSGIDYLNQIAPPERPAGSDRKFKMVLIISVIVAIGSIASILLMAGRQNTGPSPVGLMARFQKLQTITSNYDKKLRSSELQAANSSLSAVLTTANNSIYKIAPSVGVDLKKQSKTIASIDPSTEIEKRLNEAFLTYGSLDDTYKMEMNLQLEETILMMQQLERGTKSSSLKEFLQKTLEDFTSLQKHFKPESSNEPGSN